MLLGEENLLRRPFQCLPSPHPALVTPQLSVAELLPVAPLEVVKDRLGLQPGFSSKNGQISDQTSWNGSSRVLQVFSSDISLDSRSLLRYLRAVFLSIPAFAALRASLSSSRISFLSLLTWLSLTIPVCPPKDILDDHDPLGESGILIVVTREF